MGEWGTFPVCSCWFRSLIVIHAGRNKMLHPEGERHFAGVGLTGQRPVADGRWNSQIKGEPCLDDLLDDPIMALLWRNSHLEPAKARAMVRALQVLVQRR